MGSQTWELTGAVTFFFADVKIRGLKVTGNSSEDALNLVNSEIDIENLHIADTPSDGLDVDFCKGKISKSYFLSTGNDALDFSTSTINLSEVKIKNAGDKGVSAGENSQIRGSRIRVDGAKFGFVSKDNSTLQVKDSTVKNAQIGFSVYVKKMEFGPARIALQDVKFESVKELYQLEKKSSAIFNGRKINGKMSRLADDAGLKPG
jgi:hypothetical protein